MASHAGPSLGPARPLRLEPAAGVALARSRQPYVAQRKRVALIEAARAARESGALELGEFLLRANAIDAEAEGSSFDLDAARAQYRVRLARLESELSSTAPEVAVPEVFGDVAYTGTPGGRMGDALINRRGSCEPVSHMVAAALHDAGVDDVRLRFYGGAIAGVTHVTPVLLVGSNTPGHREELDLMTGGPSAPGGTDFVASELVEAYARAHGLREAEVGPVDRTAAVHGAIQPSGGLGDAGSMPPTRTLTRGYPINADTFEGSLPLFAERAIAPASTISVGVIAPRPEPPPCAFYVALAWLDLPSAQVIGAGVDVDLVREPSRVELERLSTVIVAAEMHRANTDLEPRLLSHACLTALYDHAGLMFSLAGQREVSQRAVDAAKRERRAGSLALGELAALGTDARREVIRRLDQSAMGRAWILLFLDGGEALLTELAGDPSIRYGRTMALTAMLVAPRTREKAVALADSMPLKMQLDLMHELTHAHDHARPWAATYDLDLSDHPAAAETKFARALQVFHGVAWRLWEAALTPEDTVAALDREAKGLGLDEASRRAIALYYVKHFYRLYKSRQAGGDLILRAFAALEAHGLPNVEELASDNEDLLPHERLELANMQ